MVTPLSGSVHLGSAGISALGSVIGGLTGGLLNAAASETAYHHQRDLMNLQAKLNYKYAKKSALNQYSWQRQGLENANFNPMLAWQGAEGVANTGWTSGQSVTPADFSGVIPNATSIFDQWQKLQINKEQIRNIGSQTELNEANTDQARSQVTLNNAESMLKMLQQEGQSIENRLKHIDLRWSDKEHLANLLKTNSETRSNLVNSTANIMNAETNKFNADTQRHMMKGMLNYMIDKRILTLTQAKLVERQFDLLPIQLKAQIIDNTEKNVINMFSGGLIGGSMLYGNYLNNLKYSSPNNAYQDTNVGF